MLAVKSMTNRFKLIRLIISLSSKYEYLKRKGPSRLGLVRIILKPGLPLEADLSTRYLLEYNSNKIKVAEELFGVKLVMLNPFTVSYPFAYRLGFLLIIPFGKKYRDILFSVLVRYWIERFLPKKSLLYFYNPYACIHWAFSGCAMAHYAYIHTACYPLFQSKFYACDRTIREIYGIPENVCFEVRPPHNLTNRKLEAIKFYFTKLSRNYTQDLFLKSLALHAVKNSSLDVHIYLHYLDDNLEAPFDEKCLNDRVIHEKSLLDLCDNQVSISGASSVGYEVASIIETHFILYEPEHIKPWQIMFHSLNNFVRCDRSVSIVYDDILTRSARNSTTGITV